MNIINILMKCKEVGYKISNYNLFTILMIEMIVFKFINYLPNDQIEVIVFVVVIAFGVSFIYFICNFKYWEYLDINSSVFKMLISSVLFLGLLTTGKYAYYMMFIIVCIFFIIGVVQKLNGLFTNDIFILNSSKICKYLKHKQKSLDYYKENIDNIINLCNQYKFLKINIVLNDKNYNKKKIQYIYYVEQYNECIKSLIDVKQLIMNKMEEIDIDYSENISISLMKDEYTYLLSQINNRLKEESKNSYFNKSLIKYIEE